ncbi:MAG: DNA-binding protein WhiA [Lachnospiraceae bacterium]|jgi:DNA-binding protein WhiA|nr:DNA-binding protein WhiA [Lachnospiraceae bacterium]
MSFSGEVKEELSRQLPKSRHCQIAEIAAILSFAGKLEEFQEGKQLSVYTENIFLARKYFMLIREAFHANMNIAVRQNVYLHKSRMFVISLKDIAEIRKVLQAVKWQNEQGEDIRSPGVANGILVQKSCCRRAFIRGAFLSAGSMSNPEKSYHFELVCAAEGRANQLQEIINSFQMDAKIVKRKKSYVVYLKEGEQIVDMLNIMEAHVALMDLENVRILKEMRNSVNRQVNCETANINKTVNAAVKQVEDINYIKSVRGLDSLPDNLKEIALLRLKYPQAALKELGTFLDPPVGKSGVNHRLRKICELAEDLKQAKKR